MSDNEEHKLVVKPFKEFMNEVLKDMDMAVAYLDYFYDEHLPLDQRTYLVREALEKIIKANGGKADV